jgi:hypothetical protein
MTTGGDRATACSWAFLGAPENEAESFCMVPPSSARDPWRYGFLLVTKAGFLFECNLERPSASKVTIIIMNYFENTTTIAPLKVVRVVVFAALNQTPTQHTSSW